MHFRFALNMMSEKIGRTVLSIVLAVLGLVVIIFTVIQGVGTKYAYMKIDNLLTSGFDKTARLRMNEVSQEFLNDLAIQPEIASVGDIMNYQVYNLPELAEIQNAHSGKNTRGLELITVSIGAQSLCKLRLQDGHFETKFPDKKTEYLYLGAGFRNIPIGTTYKTEYTNYIVAGILEKSQRFLSYDLAMGFDQNRSDYTLNCDYSVIDIVQYPFTDGLWLSAAQDYTLEQSLGKIFEIAEKHNVEIKYRTLQKSYEDAMINILAVKNIFSKLLPIVCISCIVMILCLQLSDLFENIRGLGIMYSQGFSQTDIERIIVLKKMFIFFIALVISSLPIYGLVNFWYNNSGGGDDVILNILLRYALPVSVAVIMGITVVSTMFSIILFRKYTPIEMIGGHND